GPCLHLTVIWGACEMVRSPPWTCRMHGPPSPSLLNSIACAESPATFAVLSRRSAAATVRPNRCSSRSGPPAVISAPPGPRLVQPVPFLELARQVGLGQVLEVLVGERVELVLEAARQHALDLLLPVLLLEPGVVEQLPGARDVLVVELDADVARELVALGV